MWVQGPDTRCCWGGCWPPSLTGLLLPSICLGLFMQVFHAKRSFNIEIKVFLFSFFFLFCWHMKDKSTIFVFPLFCLPLSYFIFFDVSGTLWPTAAGQAFARLPMTRAASPWTTECSMQSNVSVHVLSVCGCLPTSMQTICASTDGGECTCIHTACTHCVFTL